MMCGRLAEASLLPAPVTEPSTTFHIIMRSFLIQIALTIGNVVKTNKGVRTNRAPHWSTCRGIAAARTRTCTHTCSQRAVGKRTCTADLVRSGIEWRVDGVAWRVIGAYRRVDGVAWLYSEVLAMSGLKGRKGY